MKKRFFLTPVFFLLAALVALVSSSFTSKSGGDVLELYRNGKLVLQQFMYGDKTVKKIQFDDLQTSDKLEVKYLHCGTVGKSRTLTLKDASNKLVKEWRFPDTGDKRSGMALTGKDLLSAGQSTGGMQLFYEAKEMEAPQLLVNLGWQKSQAVAQR